LVCSRPARKPAIRFNRSTGKPPGGCRSASRTLFNKEGAAGAGEGGATSASATAVRAPALAAAAAAADAARDAAAAAESPPRLPATTLASGIVGFRDSSAESLKCAFCKLTCRKRFGKDLRLFCIIHNRRYNGRYYAPRFVRSRVVASSCELRCSGKHEGEPRVSPTLNPVTSRAVERNF
jgi:hypothetical protein